MLKIRGSVIFKECATKSSVFIQSNSGRNICLLSTIWRNSRYERPRIHFHPGPQVRHARRAVHCLKSVKTGNCLRAVQETKVHKTDEVTYHRRSYNLAWDRTKSGIRTMTSLGRKSGIRNNNYSYDSYGIPLGSGIRTTSLWDPMGSQE